MHRAYWDEFYAARASAVPDLPSGFARWVHDHGNHTDHTRTLLVDVGTGTGRDGLWFARRGLHVLGLDFSPVAVEVAARKAAQHGLSARFEQFDLYDEPAVLERAAGIAAAGPEPSIYARFLLHALEDAGRHNFWAFAKAAGGRTCCEFRTGKDATAVHVFGEHFRRFLDPALVLDEIASLDGEVVHHEEGHGLAPYKDEDPHVCRVVVRWS